MRAPIQFLALLLVTTEPAFAQQHEHTAGMQHSNDSAFAAVQRRGQTVMGVDQYTSTHVFAPLPDGGRIELQRDSADSAGTAQIRTHLAEVAAQLTRGDFSAPFLVHDQAVPGTAVMAAKRDKIRYTVHPLPRGGEIRITTKDRQALAAVQEFLAFQRSDHRAGDH